jgi:hypothetical protein
VGRQRVETCLDAFGLGLGGLNVLDHVLNLLSHTPARRDLCCACGLSRLVTVVSGAGPDGD